MGKKGDYVPRGDAEYNGWYKHITQYVSVKTGGTAPEWAHIVDARLTELLKAYENWYAAHAPCLKPHTDAETKTRNERKTAVTRIMRAFVQQFLMFPPVTDADRSNMKLPVRDKTHTLIPRPDKPPVFVLRPKSNRSIQIDFRAEEGGGRAKPYEYAVVVVVNYVLLDHPPADYRELTEHKFVTSRGVGNFVLRFLLCKNR